MKFTVLGHGALSVEADGTRLLIDPWLLGSCYWRSWWHYPPISDVPESWLAPEYLYLTHHHFDHFHYPTLRRVDRNTHILVPEVAIDFMVGELRNLGFSRITELPHGQRTRLTGDFEIASFQYGFDDSALVITDGRTVIVNLNDCKIRGRPLHQIITNFEHPTFLLKNYSWAQSYPICYRAENPADLELLSRDSYIQDFLQTVRETEPKYAIPFASMVCLLHPETRHLNKELITSPEVAEAFARSGITTTELVTFNPGDSWDDKSGFTRSHDDYYRDRDVRISQLEADVAPAIERSLAEEAARELTFEAFANYFGDFLRALPPGIGWLLRRPVVFEGPNAAQPYWILDFRRRTVWRSATLPEGRANLVRIPPGVLADAIEKRITYYIHISMRLEVDLRPAGHKEDLFFWGLLAIWELGYLPLRRTLRVRALRVVWRRRAEFWEAVVSKLFGRGPLVARMTTNLMTDEAPSETEAVAR